MEWRVPLSDLDYKDEETNAVLRVLENRWLTMGSITQEFETRFAETLGAKHAVAVSNGTVALHLACLALGIGPTDEVIVPSLTFVATANAVLYTGAKVRFADVISRTELNISPEEIERLINPNTKAIIVVHYGGYPCRMPEILELARQHGLSIIEDSAHAPGASLDGIALGTWGEFGCFSFFSNKNLITGEGGMLVTNREDLAEKARLLRSHGMTTLTWDRHKGHAFTYDVIELGFNYRIDEIRASLGLVQLEKLMENNSKRKTITQNYWQALINTGLEFPFCEFVNQQGINPAYHLFPILLPPKLKRTVFMDRLRQAGIQTSIHYPPIHKFSYHKKLYPGIKLKQTEQAASREVTLPLFPGLDDDALELIVQSVLDALEH